MIDQLELLDVNKSKQWVLYRGEDQRKPIVLFVHGGPGSPLMMFSRAFDSTFMKDFVVVHWDQRLAGKSYSADVSLDTLTLDQIVSDGLVVVDHLKKKFSRSKVIIVGHSWGTIVASHMVKANPSNFASFVSVGTVSDYAAADELKYGFLKTKIEASSGSQEIAEIKALGRPPYTSFEQAMALSRLLGRYDGIFHNLTQEAINRAVMKTREYSHDEMEAQGKGMKGLFEKFIPFLSTYKAVKAIDSLEVKTVFVQGRFDLATPLELTEHFVEHVKVPLGKKLIIFEKSAHFPMYEEPERFLDVLRATAAT